MGNCLFPGAVIWAPAHLGEMGGCGVFPGSPGPGQLQAGSRLLRPAGDSLAPSPEMGKLEALASQGARSCLSGDTACVNHPGVGERVRGRGVSCCPCSGQSSRSPASLSDKVESVKQWQRVCGWRHWMSYHFKWYMFSHLFHS